MELDILTDILIILALSIAILFVSHRLRLPTIVGFLLTGILAGPHGFGLIGNVSEVESLAEIGIVLLLFTIGLEFSLERLLKIRKSVVVGGSLQVMLTFLAGFLIAFELGQPVGQSIFIGFLISLSSTAIVLKIMQERAEIDTPHGRTALGILIFQDIIIVPMILLIPALAGAPNNGGESALLLLAKAIGIIILVIIGARWVVPQLLFQVARTRNRELFLLSIIGIGLTVAWLTSAAGLSLALGAFLAGLIISESEYSHQALGNVMPFRDVFTSIFFISIGMLLDVSFVLAQPVFVVLLALGVLLIKTIVSGAAVTLLGFPVRTVVLSGLALSQVGEFSFVLSESGVRYGLLTGPSYQLFLSVVVLTMAATPLVLAAAPRVADLVARLPLPRRIKFGSIPEVRPTDVPLNDHLIIIGFGFNGQNVARAATASNIPYIAIEMNPDTVKEERERGEPIVFGDATQEAVLEHANVKDARVVVVAISDPAATRRITALVEHLNPSAYVIVRTRYIQEIEPLYALGANEVIPEEFETSVEIFTRVLQNYLVPREEIESFIDEIRSGGYEIFRSLPKDRRTLANLDFHLPDIDVMTFRVKEGSQAAGRSLAQLELRKKYGVSLLAVKRNSETITNPGGETLLEAGDLVVAVGTRDKITKAEHLFRDSYR